MKLPTPKKQLGAFSNNDTIEAITSSLGSIGAGVKDTIVKDTAKSSLDDLWSQILGSESPAKTKNHGEMHAGEEIDLKNAHKQEKHEDHQETEYNYHEEILHGEKRIHAEDSREISIKIQEIMIELRQVIESSKELQVQFQQVTVEQVTQKAGKYHLNFVEWMLENVREIRMRIEDSGAWLGAMSSKKDKKQYWSMFKKHGTTFGLSNERNVATQVG